MTLSDAIKEIGRRYGISPTEIAAVLGRSDRSLQRWMQGEVEHPPRNDLLVIKAMLEHGDLVSDTLNDLYHVLLMFEEEGSRPDPPAEAQPPSP